MGNDEAHAAGKRVTVNFATGRDLLRSYWGLLANGGLMLEEPRGLHEGDAVLLEVTIASTGETFEIRGKVLRTPHDPQNHDRVVIAFDAGEPHDLLLDAAWAESEHTAARRQRRFPMDVDIRFHSPEAGDDELKGRLLNLSFGGCCVRMTRTVKGKFTVGDALTLISQRSRLPGVVRWSEGSCRGIEFAAADSAVVEHFVKQFL